jgi:hypothetical protein
VAFASSPNQASSVGSGNYGSPQNPSTLNPIELSSSVRFYLKQIGLTNDYLAHYLKVTTSNLNNLLYNKKPWKNLSNLKRKQYQLMNAWFIEHKQKEPGKVVVPAPMIDYRSHTAVVPNPEGKAPTLRAVPSEEVSSLI